MKTVSTISHYGFALGLFALAFFGVLLGEPAQADSASNLPATCYIFSYFLMPGHDGIRLAWSRDGLRWTPLNGGKPYLNPVTGTNFMGASDLMRGPDGVFRLVWGCGRPRAIGYACSQDLIHWSDEKLIHVMEAEPTARNCWAPVVYYDDANHRYMIIWSSTIPGQFPRTAHQTDDDYNHRFYMTTTTDFETFTPAKLFYDPGFCAIDAIILPASNKFYLIFKNEMDRPIPQKNLWMASSNNMAGPYGDLTGTIETNPSSWIEGPTAIKIGNDYIIYYDCYRDGHYGAVRSDHMHGWKDITSELSMPAGIRHGSILAVPASVVENLLRAQ